MPSIDRQKLDASLAQFMGLPVLHWGRAGNMLSMQFGRERQIPSRKGGLRSVGDWALHVQCAWRVVARGEILVGSGDFYRDARSGEHLEDSPDIGECAFDRITAGINSGLAASPWVVRRVVQDGVGGFAMEFASDAVLTLFPSESSRRDNEDWRMFRPGDEAEHWVVPDDFLLDAGTPAGVQP